MKKLLTAVAFLAALFAGPASAQFYLGAGAGASDTDSNESSWKTFIGYQFTPRWGVEVGYTDLGDYRGGSVDSSFVAGSFTHAFGERWSILAKLGQTWNSPHAAGVNKNSDFYAAVGVGYNFNKHLGLRLEYEDYGELSDSPGPIGSGSNLALSVKYGF